MGVDGRQGQHELVDWKLPGSVLALALGGGGSGEVFFFFLSFLNHNHEQGRSKARPARLVEVISGGLCWVETVREGGPV